MEKATMLGALEFGIIVAAESALTGAKKPKTVADVMSYPFPVVNTKTNVSTFKNILLGESAVLVSGGAALEIIGIVTEYNLMRSATQLK